jgi:predicted component of type VI protein secretion system
MQSLFELLRPIPGPNPSGEDTRYTGVYDLIQEARREELDLSQGVWVHERKTADWRAVVNLCTDALINKTKDLQIAAWLTEALVKREGFSGLELGLGLLRGLVDKFWTTVYPRSEEDELDFRVGLLEWVASRLDVSVKSIPFTPGGIDWFKYAVSKTEFQAWLGELDSCLAALEELHATCEAQFGEMTPDFDGLRTSLATVKRTVETLSGESSGNLEPDVGNRLLVYRLQMSA